MNDEICTNCGKTMPYTEIMYWERGLPYCSEYCRDESNGRILEVGFTQRQKKEIREIIHEEFSKVYRQWVLKNEN